MVKKDAGATLKEILHSIFMLMIEIDPEVDKDWLEPTSKQKEDHGEEENIKFG